MYHYQKNIGDYRSATMHLSLLEHGVYNQLLDWYYLDEQPLSGDNRTLFRRLSAKSEIEQQAVIDVLAEMFVQTDAGWVHKRVEREISQYRLKAEQARAAGKLGGRPSKKGIGSTENRDGFQKEPNAKPTDNREPLTKNQEPKREKPLASQPSPAQPSKPEKPKREQVTLLAYLESCKASKSKPIPDGHSIRAWATDAGLAPEMLQIAWLQFRERYTEGEKAKGKRYKDWPAHFATAVKANWFKLWFLDDAGHPAWTTVGLTHKAVLDAKAKRETANV